ncbi:MAG: hypothetical protein PVH84_17810, partial [Candidatus Aminicenantes bacterium]
MNVSSIYRIKIQGELPESWSERLQGMVITVERSDEEGPVTTLEGPLRDQAALSGVLNTLYDRHFAVLAVERIKKPKG